jgi:hypothetical protein
MQLTNTQVTDVYHVLDPRRLEEIRAWVMNPDHHAQLIDQQLGDQQAWMVAVTDYTEPEAIVTDRRQRFLAEFAEAVEEKTNE